MSLSKFAGLTFVSVSNVISDSKILVSYFRSIMCV